MTLEFSFEAIKGLEDRMIKDLSEDSVILLRIKNSEDNIE